MGIFSRLFGICKTQPPADASCWSVTGNSVVIDLTKAAELKPKGGAIRLEGNGLPMRVLVVHGEDGQLHAFHNKCTHAGRRIDPLPGDEKIECCSVGKSTWDYDGKLISGSAKDELTCFAVTSEDDKATINLTGQH